VLDANAVAEREGVGATTPPDERAVANAVTAMQNVGAAEFSCSVLDANTAGQVGAATCCVDAATCSEGVYDAAGTCVTGCSVPVGQFSVQRWRTSDPH
jgi:hypothetical protein